MTKITIDRAVVERALETIEDLTRDRLFTAEWAGKHGATITAIRAALAQQDEPKPMSPEQRQRWEELAAMPQQDEPEGGVCARCGALAFDPVVKQQAEPAEPVAYFGSAYVNENGVHITTVLGPVAIPQDAKLYTAPPQRRPLTEEEIDRITRDRWGTQLLGVMVQAHREYARAVEKASWEKNHGQA